VSTPADGPATEDRAAVRASLGTTGRHEFVPLRDALAAGAGAPVLLAAGCLLTGPWMLALLPTVVSGDVSRSTGTTFGPTGLAAVVGAGLALLALASMLRRGTSRRLIALGSSAAAAATLLAVAVSRQPPGLAPMLAGALLVLAHGAVSSAVCDLYPPAARVRALATVTAVGVAGAASVPLLIALGNGAGLTWRGSTLVLAGLAGLCAIGGTTVPEAPLGALDEAPARDSLRARTGEEGQDEAPAPAPVSQMLRMLVAPPSVRPVLALAGAAGLLLGPLPEAIRLVQRDRWVVVATARPLFVAAVLALGVGAVLLSPRLEVAWRAAPARLLHQVTWGLVLGGVALAAGAVMPHPFLALAPLAVGAGACTCALLGALASTSRTGPADLRPLVAGAAGLALTIGAVGGDLVLGAFASRFGTAWGLVALGSLLLGYAAVGVRAVGLVAVDAEAAVDRVLDAERLASARRRGLHVPLLECRGIDFSYGQLQVLFDVSFTVDTGEMVALLGTNGAGKSTLLRVISGLGTPSRGSVALAGRDITYLSSEARVGAGITQVPGGKAVFGSLSVVDNLRAYGYSLGRDTARVDAGIEETFEAFPRLAERRNQLAATLSGGEQQMLALGKSLILEPRLLLIDELSLGLAPKIVGELLQMVERINRAGTAIVLVEQSVNIALSLVDHAYFMEKGQVRFDGKASSLLERPDLLRSVFLAEARAGDAVPSPAPDTSLRRV
jgi:ABC-type branched-subunit amino acid transport system ATPase component